MTDTLRMNVNPTQYEMLHRLADVASLRQKIISNNIANVNTPGYHKLRLRFETFLADQLQQTGSTNVDNLRPLLVEDLSGTYRVDGNNVDINEEMGRMNKNLLLHNTYLQILSTKLAMMRRAITGT